MQTLVNNSTKVCSSYGGEPFSFQYTVIPFSRGHPWRIINMCVCGGGGEGGGALYIKIKFKISKDAYTMIVI